MLSSSTFHWKQSNCFGTQKDMDALNHILSCSFYIEVKTLQCVVSVQLWMVAFKLQRYLRLDNMDWYQRGIHLEPCQRPSSLILHFMDNDWLLLMIWKIWDHVLKSLRLYNVSNYNLIFFYQYHMKSVLFSCSSNIFQASYTIIYCHNLRPNHPAIHSQSALWLFKT